MLRRAKIMLPAVLAVLCTLSVSAFGQEARPSLYPLRKSMLGDTPNVSQVGLMLLCGQPSVEDLKLAHSQGLAAIIVSLRTDKELSWDESKAVKDLGMEYVPIPFGPPNDLNDDVFQRVRKVLREAEEQKKPVMLHCAGATRVGAVWLAFRVLDQKQSLKEALSEARAVGLRGGYESRALDYIKKEQQQAE